MKVLGRLLLLFGLFLFLAEMKYSAFCEKIGSVKATKMEALNSYFLAAGLPAFFEYNLVTKEICLNKNVENMPETKKSILVMLNKI